MALSIAPALHFSMGLSVRSTLDAPQIHAKMVEAAQTMRKVTIAHVLSIMLVISAKTILVAALNHAKTAAPVLALKTLVSTVHALSHMLENTVNIMMAVVPNLVKTVEHATMNLTATTAHVEQVSVELNVRHMWVAPPAHARMMGHVGSPLIPITATA